MNKTLDAAFTIRWNAKEILKQQPDNGHAKDIVEEATGIISSIGQAQPGDDVTPEKPVDPPFSASGLYPPFAHVMTEQMKTRGPYTGTGTPVGAIVHFTAGRDGAEQCIRYGRSQGYAYWCIQEDGLLYCAHPYDKWGNHAGVSKWPGLGDSVSDSLLGIEICNAGQLDKLADGTFKSWFGKIYQANEVRYVDGKSPDQEEGYYHKYTPAQEATLINTLLWLKARNPSVFNLDYVLGHCEVAGKLGLGYFRKNDPGGALSMPMAEFRKLLKQKWGK